MKLYPFTLLLSCWSSLFFSNHNQNQGFTQVLPGTDIAIEMVYIPSTGKNTAKVKDTNTSTAIYISKYEITWDLYKLFLERTIDKEENMDRLDQVNISVDGVTGATAPYVDMSIGMGSGAGLPVCNVTPLSASRFCQWLSARTGRFYRLPTEQEWEVSALAGAESTYFFGENVEELNEYAWISENSDRTYHPVGEKKPNRYGLYDVYGNVAEWALRKKMDNENNREEFTPVLKGGGYHMYAKDISTAVYITPVPAWKERDPQFPRSKWWYTDAGFAGFRIVSPEKTPPESEFTQYWNVQ
jgi:formylglycine-generating enzyme required for sulfatase activity